MNKLMDGATALQNTFINTRDFTVEKIIPQEDLSRMQKINDDSVYIEGSEKLTLIQIIIQGITKKDMKAFKGDLTIIHQDYDVPFIVLKYKGMRFEVPIAFGTHEKVNTSHLCIQVVERKNHVLKLISNIELNEQIATKIASSKYITDGPLPNMYSLMVGIDKVYTENFKNMSQGGTRHFAKGGKI